MASLNIKNVYSIIDAKVLESSFLTREMNDKSQKQRTKVLNQQPLTDTIKDYLGKRVEQDEELESDISDIQKRTGRVFYRTNTINSIQDNV